MPFTNLKKKVQEFDNIHSCILRNWESLCDIRPDCHHHFDASGTSNAMFDELAERSLKSPLAGTKHSYVRLAIIIYCNITWGNKYSSSHYQCLIDQSIVFLLWFFLFFFFLTGLGEA